MKVNDIETIKQEIAYLEKEVDRVNREKEALELRLNYELIPTLLQKRVDLKCHELYIAEQAKQLW